VEDAEADRANRAHLGEGGIAMPPHPRAGLCMGSRWLAVDVSRELSAPSPKKTPPKKKQTKGGGGGPVPGPGMGLEPLWGSWRMSAPPASRRTVAIRGAVLSSAACARPPKVAIDSRPSARTCQ
jgi:hypothetical protein